MLGMKKVRWDCEKLPCCVIDSWLPQIGGFQQIIHGTDKGKENEKAKYKFELNF